MNKLTEYQDSLLHVLTVLSFAEAWLIMPVPLHSGMSGLAINKGNCLGEAMMLNNKLKTQIKDSAILLNQN